MSTTEVRVPDIGDFERVPVIEVLVKEGDRIEQEASLITLESDKATMEVPSPSAGLVRSLAVAVDDEVSEGDLVLTLETSEEPESEGSDDHDREPVGEGDDPVDEATAQAPAPAEAASEGDFDHDLVVLGSGPGGYTAAFRAADLGLDVVLVERYPTLGGVCLNVGCIPSKTLLHTAAVMQDVKAMAGHGVVYGEPEIQLDPLRAFKDGVVDKLVGGIAGLAKRREVTVIQGVGRFTGEHQLEIEHEGEQRTVSFGQAIIAAGSESMKLPGLPWDDPRVMDSTGALELEEIPGQLLIIGGGIIGLEMACVYAALGSTITVVEMMEQLMPGADPDLVRPLQKRLEGQGLSFHLGTRVSEVRMGDDALYAVFEGDHAPERTAYDRVLVAVGRTPNGNNVGADAAGVEVDERGFIAVDRQLRTNVSHIFAIGDLVGQPMLAHKASHEGKVAAEVAAGHKSEFVARVIPSVAYTDPEVAWAGLTESEAKERGVGYEVGKFPWAASGRALGNDRAEGFTKLLFDPETRRIVGAGIVGPQAGDLIAECCLAIEMGAEAADIGLTIHAHPTLSETVAFAAEAFEGTITDLYLPRRR